MHYIAVPIMATVDVKGLRPYGCPGYGYPWKNPWIYPWIYPCVISDLGCTVDISMDISKLFKLNCHITVVS